MLPTAFVLRRDQFNIFKAMLKKIRFFFFEKFYFLNYQIVIIFSQS